MSYRKALNALVDQIFQASGDMTLQQMADASGLCVKTVYNLNDRVTKLPRFQTVWALARAVNLDLRLVRAVQQRRAS